MTEIFGTVSQDNQAMLLERFYYRQRQSCLVQGAGLDDLRSSLPATLSYESMISRQEASLLERFYYSRVLSV